MESVELVAQEMGFYNGRLVAPGEKFTFSGAKRPKWAAEPGKAVVKKTPALGYDTKPKEAQAAVKAKAAAA